MLWMPSLYMRLHAASKAAYLGVISVLAAVALLGAGEWIGRAVLITLFMPADLVVLDLAVASPDGLAVCRRLRDASGLPGLIVTGPTETAAKLRAFEAGADDYLTRPFASLELQARPRALGRRALIYEQAAAAEAPPPQPPLKIDDVRHTIRLDGRRIHLTETEHRLLKLLTEHAGEVVQHRAILEHVWGEACRYEIQ